jgi:hypothetical protein
MLPVFLFNNFVWFLRCNAYLRADFVIYWTVDPETPRCANCETVVAC